MYFDSHNTVSIGINFPAHTFLRSLFFLFFLFLSWGNHVYASIYYVDYDGGSDSNDGLAALTAFKHSPTDTAATGNAVSVTPVAGDTICFKGSVTYRGTPKPETAGTENSPVTWDGECAGFGSGKAVIDGSEILSGCTSDALVNGHQSYVCPLPSGLPTNAVPFALNLYQGEQKMVLAQATPMANYYNTDNTDEYFSIPFAQAVRTADATEVTDATNLTPYFSDYQNSYLKIWVYGNRISTLLINGVDIPSNKLIAERASYDPLDDSGSARYTIINHRAAFDSLGEYWVDVANSQIYLIPPSSFDPNDSDITYSKRQEAFDVRASYNLIKNMIVQKGAAGTAQYRHNGGIRIYNGNITPRYTGITIDNVESRYNNSIEGYAAIYVEYADYTTVQNSYVHHNAPNRGIHVTSSDYALVENNEVTAIDGTAIAFFDVNYGSIMHNYVHDNASVHGNGITTYLSSDHNTIAYNRVINSQIAYTTQASATNTIAFNIFSTPADSGVTVAAWSSAGTSHLEFYNNIILNGTPGSGLYVASDSEVGLVIKNNIMDGGPILAGSNISNNIYTSLAYNQSAGYGWSLGSGEVEATYDQLFLDEQNGDYQPKADSASIDTGADMSASPLTEDLLGFSLVDRMWDIGAYEYVSPVSTSSPIAQVSSGGGGGGSSSSKKKTAVATTTATTTVTTTSSDPEIQRLLTLLAQLRAQLATLLGNTASTPVSTITRDLELGMEGEDVRTLQQYLNTHGYIITTTGPGSPNNETTRFGPATHSAVIRYQNAHRTELGIQNGTGYVGEKTRRVMGL